jgi:hypothetical protein
MKPVHRYSRLPTLAAAACLFANLAAAATCVAPTRTILGLPLAVSFATTRTAPPPVDCNGAAPTVGQFFEGTVVEVLDGRTLCVAQGPAASDWVLVRLAGAPLATTRQTLMAASFARTLTCVAARGMQAGVEARCAVDGAPLDRVIGTNEARLQGLAWR